MGGYAWVTLATNDSYSLGALVLAHSLKQAGTQQQLAVLVTPGVTGSMREKLSQVFNIVQEVNILDSKDEANLRLLKRPELGITFTKLHCWRLTQFEKCVFLDADTLVLENCDELFEREELSAAPDVGWPDCFNSGVFVYRPSNETYEKLIQFALEKGSFDGGDQGLLNLYFSDWAYKDISKHLPFIYNMCSTACYSYLPAFKQFGGNAKIIHFIGATKPWLQYFDTESKTVHPSEGAQHIQDILQRWWNIFCSLIHPNLTPDMPIEDSQGESKTPSQDTVHGSPSNVPQPTLHIPHYGYYHIPTPNVPTPAEDYQNVWDPWEEYDLRQSQNRSSTSNISHVFHSPPNQEQVNITESPGRLCEEHGITLDIHAHSEDHSQSSNFFETHSHSIESNQQNQLVESHNTNAYFVAGHHDSHDDQHNSAVDSHNFHPPTPTYSQPQYPPRIHPVPHIPLTPTYNQPQWPLQIDPTPHNPPTPTYSQPQWFPQIDPTPHNPPTPTYSQPQWLPQIDPIPHNPPTPTYNLPQCPPPNDPTPCNPPTPTYSQPQYPTLNDPTPHNVVHSEPPPEKPMTTEPPPSPQNSYPRLPDECVATTTVSNEITLYSSTNEDSNDNNSGLAGAFAQLTLGTARTPEQAALDDHLRRQGWEVGNIDYLGRDSFENIWSKICETLSSGPEQPAPKPKVIPEKTSEPTKPQEPETIPEPVEDVPVVLEEQENQSVESKPSSEANVPPDSTTPETESPQPAPEPIIPQPTSQSPQPDESSVITEIPQPLEEVSSPKTDVTQSEEPTKPTEPAPAEPLTDPTPVKSVEITPPSVPVTESPQPTLEAVPSSPEPIPERPKTDTVLESPVSVPDSVPESPKPTPEPVPESIPEVLPEILTPAPEVITESPKPAPEVVPEIPTPAPEVVPEIPTPAPEVVPESPTPAPEAVPLPESPKPAPDPIPASPELPTETPSVVPTPVAEAESPKPAAEVVPVSPKSAPKTEKSVPKSVTAIKTTKSESTKAGPESPKLTPESPQPVPESPTSESVPLVCPVAPKSPAEKKPGTKKSSPKEAPQPPKPEVTEATPPTTPISPQPKQTKQQALVVETSVPDTPPPASSEASATTPTPPPRKSSGAPKKPSTKTKK
ncbi:hypothetical protein NQ314_020676 [Rhamnusium bicolor]|uniref:glycogenin glucosyltransferase n=1 Tax=Rhamnusium bicolor TaxID=1586634 RepID=A0AAV8WKR8_9CUCU|nr:hypothetical protein NQ314_020676 [Rhamnusium bicolor]